MKQKDAVKAYMAASNLNMQVLSDGRTARKIFNLVRTLKPIWEFQSQEENKICTEHPDVNPANMTIALKEGLDKEDAIKELDDMQEKFRKLGNMEIEVDFTKFTIDLGMENIRISGKEIGDLEPFIDFTDGAEDHG